MTDNPHKLRPQHLVFVAEYLKCLNATQAAIKAGYNPGKKNASAKCAAARLMARENIRAEIDRRLDASHSSDELTKEGFLLICSQKIRARTRESTRWAEIYARVKGWMSEGNVVVNLPPPVFANPDQIGAKIVQNVQGEERKALDTTATEGEKSENTEEKP